MCSKSLLAVEQLMKMKMRRKKAVGRAVRIIMAQKTGVWQAVKDRKASSSNNFRIC